jgi:hypothetical protein
MIVFVLAILIYIFLIKYFQIDIYFINVKPRVGLILQNVIKYSGVGQFYNFLALNGVFGIEMKEQIMNQEISKLEDQYD